MSNEYQPGRSLRSAGAGQLLVPSAESKQGEMALVIMLLTAGTSAPWRSDLPQLF